MQVFWIHLVRGRDFSHPASFCNSFLHTNITESQKEMFRLHRQTTPQVFLGFCLVESLHVSRNLPSPGSEIITWIKRMTEGVRLAIILGLSVVVFPGFSSFSWVISSEFLTYEHPNTPSFPWHCLPLCWLPSCVVPWKSCTTPLWLLVANGQGAGVHLECVFGVPWGIPVLHQSAPAHHGDTCKLQKLPNAWKGPHFRAKRERFLVLLNSGGKQLGTDLMLSSAGLCTSLSPRAPKRILST